MHKTKLYLCKAYYQSLNYGILIATCFILKCTYLQLVTSQIGKAFTSNFPQLLKEFLIGSAYATAQRNLPSDANQLVYLLPVTTQPVGCDIEVNIHSNVICLSQDVLWNASMMLLSPQQRIVPYRVDIWTKLWDHLVKIARGKQKFKPSQVVEKLLVSLVCYQVTTVAY